MDPNAAWRELLAAVDSGDGDRLLETATALAGWLDQRGFPPDTTGGVVNHSDWNRRIARFACDVAIDMASRPLPHTQE